MKQTKEYLHHLSTILIDDEEDARFVLRRHLATSCPEVKVVAEAASLAEARKLMEQLRPNLIFLDIELRDGAGFDLLDQFPGAAHHVVFVTSHDEYALRAFRYTAADFLLKPIDEEDVRVAVQKVLQRNQPAELDYLRSLLRQPEVLATKLLLSTREGMTLLHFEEIVRLESDSGYTTFFTKENERVMVSKVIKEYEDLLPEGRFFRIHNSHVVNLAFVKQVLWEDGGTVVMHDGAALPLARRRKEGFLEMLTKGKQSGL